jgi:4-amino-4-deoxy-L-arabinose transferase-like glycosyltransferase
MTTDQPAPWQGRWRSPWAAGVALAGITASAAALRFWDLGRLGLANLFYAAAVRSEGRSLHNFLYAAFDPAGTLTVDKPPLGLWLQVISTKLFGWGGVAILLPMALAGTIAVPLVFGAARRSHGVAVGLAAAAVLAVFPESVATARDSTMDALMMALLAGGAWLLVAAVEGRRPALLIAWGALMGVVFNVKFFEGFVMLPAAALYLGVRWRGEWRSRVRTVGLAGGALALVALSWVTFVQLTPAAHRPLVMNDPSNSAYGLVLRYNGLERILPGEVAIFEPAVNIPSVVAATALAARQYGVGDAGPLRLFHEPNGALLGVTVLLALLGVAMVAWRRRDWLDGPGTLWTAWFLTGAVLFTFSNRSAAQYTESYAPALAVMAAVGLVEGWRARDSWRAAVLPAALVAIAAFGWWAVRGLAPLQRGTHVEALATAGTALIAIGSLALPGAVRSRSTLRLLPAVAVLGIPLAASLWIARYAPHSGQITRPNPLVYATRDAPGLITRLVPAEALVAAAGKTSARYAFGIDGINNAGEAIAYTGVSVLPIWNEYRREPVLPPDQFDALLRDGEVPLLALSRARLASGELATLLPVVQRDCRPAAVRANRGWAIWRCGPASATP